MRQVVSTDVMWWAALSISLLLEQTQIACILCFIEIHLYFN